MRCTRALFHTAAVSVFLAGAAMPTANSANAADKITIMVGGYEKQIYLPAALGDGNGSDRQSCPPETFNAMVKVLGVSEWKDATAALDREVRVYLERRLPSLSTFLQPA